MTGSGSPALGIPQFFSFATWADRKATMRDMADSFPSRFAAIRRAFGPLAWGFDPAGSLLERWGLGDSADGLDRFADIVIEAAVGTVGIVKPQAAFYERQGWRGIRTLHRLVSDARSAGMLVVLDAKRGDVESTNEAYAEAYLGPGAPIEVDALTVHPYLGLGAMRAFVERAQSAGSCVLVVTRSSNPEGRGLQSTGGVEDSVEATILREIGALNRDLAPGTLGPIGAVIGPTHLVPALDLRAANAIFLAPGVGAQGASPEDVAEVFADCPDRVIPSASRLLLDGGPDLGRLRDEGAVLAGIFRERLP